MSSDFSVDSATCDADPTALIGDVREPQSIGRAR
jgi:hypothetical protein